jgi:hypothetical protein
VHGAENSFGVHEVDIREGWKQLDDEQLYDSHSSPNIVREMKVTKIRWAGHVTPTGKKRNS